MELNDKSLLNKDIIKNMNVGQFYSMLTRENYEKIYNLMAEYFYEAVKEEHYLNGFLYFFKLSADELKSDELISIDIFIKTFEEELEKKKKEKNKK